MKILISALSGIGDALMFTPAISLIKKHFPEVSLEAVVMFKGVKDLYERLPELDKVYYLDFMNESKFKSLKFVLGLRANNYDASINVYPSNRKEYNLISFLIGAKKRAAAKYLRRDFSNLGWLNSVRVLESDDTHNVETNIKLCSALFNLEIKELPPMNFSLTEEDIKSAENFLTKNNLKTSDYIIGMHPGCATLKNHIKRRWKPEKFSELAKRLITVKNAKILIFGGPEEEELKKGVFEGIKDNNAFIVDTRNLAQSAALIKQCKIFITNDSSLMHVSSAMKVKTFAIIGPTNPGYIHPWKTEHKIISLHLDCAPCFFYSPRPLICSRTDVQFKCIKELTVEMVYNQICS
ncbi:MAG: glycosyltransferase family 9 protein [Bacteroidota bacterium]|nr:glycosyltransferase family 9 protein [Bacteroidota bacterium]